MPKVPVVAIGGPYDGRVFELEDPRVIVPDDPLEEPFWWSDSLAPKVAGEGYYLLDTYRSMQWREDRRTP